MKWGRAARRPTLLVGRPSDRYIVPFSIFPLKNYNIERERDEQRATAAAADNDDNNKPTGDGDARRDQKQHKKTASEREKERATKDDDDVNAQKTKNAVEKLPPTKVQNEKNEKPTDFDEGVAFCVLLCFPCSYQS